MNLYKQHTVTSENMFRSFILGIECLLLIIKANSRGREMEVAIGVSDVMGFLKTDKLVLWYYVEKTNLRKLHVVRQGSQEQFFIGRLAGSVQKVFSMHACLVVVACAIEIIQRRTFYLEQTGKLLMCLSHKGNDGFYPDRAKWTDVPGSVLVEQHYF